MNHRLPLAICNLRKSAEDCYVIGQLPNFCYMGVFDGCGGLGCQPHAFFDQEAYPMPHTSAWIASRVGAAAVESFLRGNGNEPFSQQKIPALEHALEQTFHTLKEKYWKDDGVSGSMRRNFPTTASIIVEDFQTKTVFFLWSGDSRGYLCDQNGLAQITRDDIRFHADDAFANLYRDSAMTQQWNADQPIKVHCKAIKEITPAIYLCATDGCFGFLSSPMAFEYMLLHALMKSNSPEEWQQNLKEKWFAYFGDDCTMTILPVGFQSFSDLQSFYRERLESITDTYQDSFSDDMDTEERKRLWQQTYRENYYRFSESEKGITADGRTN